jgi:hypothetical protein
MKSLILAALVLTLSMATSFAANGAKSHQENGEMSKFIRDWK